ncbi:MAG TPA: hypothetical protein VIG30_15215 [Ktedonobacterales bacterium]|jgi:hypothetical protein
MAPHHTRCCPPRPYARRAGLILPLAALLFALSGCMRVIRTLQVNADGSGVYALTIGVQEPHAGDPASLPAQVTEPLDAFAASVRQTGGSSQRYADQTYAYWSFTRPFTSIAQADTFLQDTPQRFDPTHAALLFHDALHISRQTSVFGTTFHITGSISLVDRLHNAQEWQNATEMLTITLPGGISSVAGGTRAGNSVTYRIAYNQSATIDVAGGASATISPLMLLAVALGMLAVALAVVGIILITRASRTPRAPRTVA